MKNNKGFTLVEILAVISIIGVVSILLIPTLLNVFYKSKGMLDDYLKEKLIDAGKMYVTDLDTGIKDYIYTGDKNIEIDGTIYSPGSKISGYDLRVYIIENNGINVSVKDLVKDGYFDKECNYETNKKQCKVKDTCILKVKIKSELVQNDRYYISNGYDAELLEGCE